MLTICLKVRRRRAEVDQVLRGVRAIALACLLLGLAVASAQAGGWEAPIALGGEQDVEGTAMAAASDGRVLVVWTASHGEEGYVAHLQVRGTDGALAADVRLGPGDGPEAPAVAVDASSGEALIAWRQPDGPRAATLAAGATIPGAAQRLGDRADGPIAAVAQDGRGWVAWTDALPWGSSGPADVTVARALVAGDDAPAWTAAAVGTAQARPHGEGPYELVASPVGDGALVAWSDADPADDDRIAVRTVTVPGAGNARSAATLSAPGRQSTGLAVATTPSNGAVLAWTDAAPGWFTGRVLIAAVASDGHAAAPVAPGLAVAATLGPYALAAPAAVAVGPDGRVLVAAATAEQPSVNSYSHGPARVATSAGTPLSFTAAEPVGRPSGDYGGVALLAAADGKDLLASSSLLTEGPHAAMRPDGSWGAVTPVRCPFSAGALLGAATGPDGLPLVLWRDDNPARDVRRLRLARYSPSAAAADPCPRAYGSVTATPARVGPGEEVRFDASSFRDPEATRHEYAWSVDQGGSTFGEGEQVGPDPVFRRAFLTPGWHYADVAIAVSSSTRGMGYGTGTGASVYVCLLPGCLEDDIPLAPVLTDPIWQLPGLLGQVPVIGDLVQAPLDPSRALAPLLTAGPAKSPRTPVTRAAPVLTVPSKVNRARLTGAGVPVGVTAAGAPTVAITLKTTAGGLLASRSLRPDANGVARGTIKLSPIARRKVARLTRVRVVARTALGTTAQVVRVGR